jgi:hypothetical protein
VIVQAPSVMTTTTTTTYVDEVVRTRPAKSWKPRGTRGLKARPKCACK